MMGATLKTNKEERRDAMLSDIDSLQQVLTVCWTPEEAYEWLFSPQDTMNGKTPILMLAQGKLEQLNQHLENLLDGAYQ